jgi:cob(I)alamin adenosyltransferase
VKIYTRTGDTGQTSLFGKDRISKADPRVEAYGDIDELNAWLGYVRSFTIDPDIDQALLQIQRDLFAVGAQLADPAERLSDRHTKAFITAADVTRLESLMDHLDGELPPLNFFILSGGSPPGAALHVARTVCRRAERQMVTLAPAVDAVLLQYINRLSDLLFVLARAANHRAGLPETRW